MIDKRNKQKEKKEQEKQKKMQTKIGNFIKDKKGALGFRPYVTALWVFIFFAICLLTFVLNYLQVNAPTNQLITNDSFGLVNATQRLNASFQGFQTVVNNVSVSASGATPSPLSFVFLIFEAAFYIPQTIFVLITTIPNIIIGVIVPSLAGVGLGIIGSMLGVLIAGIITITVVLLFIKTARSGESER